ncbi:hypothetical protein Q9L42_020295 (plasmid) [Methylomarinum sp. Ch1-1]|uniref:HEPN domain-containing protein n=1 Tax=Methylomarinum roseum TaxID=3067653 RepID=A0AAU7P1F4_9GAMM
MLDIARHSVNSTQSNTFFRIACHQAAFLLFGKKVEIDQLNRLLVLAKANREELLHDIANKHGMTLPGHIYLHSNCDDFVRDFERIIAEFTSVLEKEIGIAVSYAKENAELTLHKAQSENYYMPKHRCEQLQNIIAAVNA